VAPLLEEVRVSARREVVHAGHPHPWARRITLDVDPTTPPELVKQAYEDARRALGIGRTRTLNDKQAVLAVFCADRFDQPWSLTYRQWNRAHKNWAIANESNLRRDAVVAQRRLLSGASGDDQASRPVARPKRGRGELDITFEDPPPPGQTHENMVALVKNVVAALEQHSDLHR
jgi:hypothetical protein